MTFINKFKIPTILGLAIITAGIAAGVFLVLKDQTFFSKASPNLTAQNITFSNISDDSTVVSWQTSIPVPAFVTFGQANPNEQTALDDRDTNTPKPYMTHYVTLKKLSPKTTYQVKIISGKISSDILKLTTTNPINSQNGFNPVIGSILDDDKPLNEGIVYLSIPGASIQSAQVKISGNFLIPLSLIRKEDLSDAYPLSEDNIAKLTIISGNNQAFVLFKLTSLGKPLPIVKLGQNLDLTTAELPSPTPSPTTQDLKQYDLNGDGQINVNDYSIVLQNFGKKPKNIETDLNSDGVVDQKDLDLISKKINQ